MKKDDRFYCDNCEVKLEGRWVEINEKDFCCIKCFREYTKKQRPSRKW